MKKFILTLILCFTLTNVALAHDRDQLCNDFISKMDDISQLIEKKDYNYFYDLYIEMMDKYINYCLKRSIKD